MLSFLSYGDSTTSMSFLVIKYDIDSVVLNTILEPLLEPLWLAQPPVAVDQMPIYLYTNCYSLFFNDTYRCF